MKKWQSWMSLMVTSSLVLLCPNVQGEMDGDWEFGYSGSTATITGYKGPLTAIAIPSTVSRTEPYQEQDDDGEWHTHYWTYQYPVTSIGDGAFSGCSGLTSMTIPGSVTNIGRYAFYNSSALSSVTIPESVTSIGDYAFSGCSGLSSVMIPDSVTIIGRYAFYNSSALSSVTIPESVTNIGDYAFSGCSGLTSVTIPDSVTNIGAYAFLGCSGLTNVTIPDSVTIIGRCAFCDCSGLTSVTILGNVTNDWDSSFWGPFANCTNIATLDLGDKMTKIGVHMFDGCSGLTSVTIPESVTSIGDYAFSGCSGLTSVTIPDSVTNIGIGAFSGCSGLTSVFIPDSVTTIGIGAFWDCGRLTSVTIPDSVTSIGSSAFYRCSGLTNVVIGNGVTNIGREAFYFCRGLTSVTIGKCVTSIGDWAFGLCGYLASIRFAGEPPTVGAYVFEYVSDSARGYYTEPYAKAWEAVIDQDGKWKGLIMEKELRVDSANPAEGSLTLAWEMLEAETEGVTYSVWRGAGEERKDAKCVTNGLTENSWEDKEYWKEKPVVKPLNYWVVATKSDGKERESNRVETRHRYGVFVGVEKYAENFENLLNRRGPLPMADVQARLFGQLASEKGGFTIVGEVLTGEKATKAALHDALQSVAGKVKTGDYVAIFCSSHGTLRRTWSDKVFRGIAMHDTVYEKEELASDLKTIFQGKNGMSVLVFLNACHSGGAISSSPEGENVAWIVSCREAEQTSTFNAMGAPLPHYLLEYGWSRGKAGGGAGTMATFADLWNYALPAMSSFQETGVDSTEHPGCAEPNVLKHFIAGELGNVTHEAVSGVPSAVTATVGEEEVTITWKGDGQADYYLVRRTNLDGSQPIADVKGECIAKDVEVSWYGKTYLYQIAAVNEWGVSDWSSPVNGSRLLRDLEMWIRGYFDLSADATPEELETAAASAAANGRPVWECYLTGVDPAVSDQLFKSILEYNENGKLTVKWTPDLNEDGTKSERLYWVKGKKDVMDEEWTDVTDVEDLEAEGWRFFRVGVELAE